MKASDSCKAIIIKNIAHWVVYVHMFNYPTAEQEEIMSMTKRILISLGILSIDLVIFFLPLTAIFLIYVLIFNPPWFRDFLNNLDSPDGLIN